MRALIIWIFISILLCLFPGPSFWYGFFENSYILNESDLNFYFLKMQLFMVKIEENSELKQLSAHFFLMSVCAFYTGKVLCEKFGLFRENKRIIILTIFLIFILSFIIEVCQLFLPESFARGFAWIDIIFSVCGGFLGILFFIFSTRDLNS